MSERLSAWDMSSLLAERGPIHVHVGGTLILEGEAPRFEELLDHIDGRLALVPRFRQRITETPLGLSNPIWADDPGFDLEWHVRHTALPGPGSDAQLRELVGQVMSQPLDFSRPLWQFYLVEGLEGGRFALINKTHHVLVDGVAAIDVGTIILDPTPEGTEMELPDQPWEPDQPSPDMLFVRAASERIRAPLRLARRAAGRAFAPRETMGEVLRTATAFADLAQGGPSCPPSPINAEIGRDRRVAFVQAELSRIKDARTVEGATVNDVILAVAAGALRHWFEGRGGTVPNKLVALVPVSVRRPEEKLELGNRISTVLVGLPIGEPDPQRRLELIRAETAKLKASETARAASLIIEATGWVPPTLNRVLAQAMSRPRVFNLVVSNVPGPQAPFYLLGRRLTEVYPFVPLSPQGHALSLGVLSYDGGVFFGLAGDRDEIADLDDLAAAMQAALDEQAPV